MYIQNAQHMLPLLTNLVVLGWKQLERQWQLKIKVCARKYKWEPVLRKTFLLSHHVLGSSVRGSDICPNAAFVFCNHSLKPGTSYTSNCWLWQDKDGAFSKNIEWLVNYNDPQVPQNALFIAEVLFFVPY